MPSDAVINKLVINKGKRELLVYQDNQLIKTYRISLGRSPIGHKTIEGDNKTPEGLYYINDKNSHSGYHKNLGVSYLNKADSEFAHSQGKSPGGDIKLHGIRNRLGLIGKFQRFFDWTAGCIALTNNEIDELYYAVPIGTPIYINP